MTTARGAGQGKLPLVAYNEPTGRPRYGSWVPDKAPPPSNLPSPGALPMIPMGSNSASQTGPRSYGLSQSAGQQPPKQPIMGQTWQINEPIGGQGKMPPNPHGATAQNLPFGLRGGGNTMNKLPVGLNAGN